MLYMSKRYPMKSHLQLMTRTMVVSFSLTKSP